MLACSFVGSPQIIRAGLEKFIQQTGADELMVACCYLRSFRPAAFL
jgi:hypothetical protein